MSNLIFWRHKMPVSKPVSRRQMRSFNVQCMMFNCFYIINL